MLDAVRSRIKHLVSNWSELRCEVAEAVASRAEIETRMRKAGAPRHYANLGLTLRQMREILTWSRDIRARYTVLHLAADLGCLESWSDSAIAAFPAEPPTETE